MNLKTKLPAPQGGPLGIEKIKEKDKPFSKINFWMMGGCIVLIVLGYLFMSGGGGENGEFNPEIFSTRRIVVGPLLSFLGFLLMAFAIIYSPAKRKKSIKEENLAEAIPEEMDVKVEESQP